MTPRPFYRSRLFWLGLPGLVFLLWGWWDSGAYPSHLSWSTTSRTFWVGHENGGIVSGTINSTNPNNHGIPQGFKFRRWEANAPHIFSWSLPQPLLWQHNVTNYSLPSISRNLGVETRRLEVAYWLAILIYLTPWIAALWWWQHRKSRLLKLHSAP